MPSPSRGRRTLTFFTGNRGKLTEVRLRLAPLGWNVVQGRRTLVEPQADELETVARAKLEQVPRAPGPCLVEDAGLFIHALNGFPGVYSAYVLRTLGPAVVARLVPRGDRSATFRAVMGLRGGAGGRPKLILGEVHGKITSAPRGSGGFGFDPIFVPTGERRTFAEMTPEEKDRLSHRGKALDGLVRALRD